MNLAAACDVHFDASRPAEASNEVLLTQRLNLNELVLLDGHLYTSVHLSQRDIRFSDPISMHWNRIDV